MKEQHFSFTCISNNISWINNAEKGLIGSFKIHRTKCLNPSGHLGEGKEIEVTVNFTLFPNLVQPEQCCSDSIP